MSTDLITYSANVPDFLKEAGGYRDEGLGAGIAPKAPKLSLTTAKQWTITDNGQTTILPTPTVKGVIVASAQTLTKAWYEKAFTPGTNAAPDCFSNDGKTPAAGVAKPQCANCAQCPKNAFGSHPVTGRGKACGDRKMIVVALDTMPDKLATFNIPTMSLNSLRDIDGKLRSNNIPLQSVMMEFSFDPGVMYPVAKIGAVGYIDKMNFERFRDLAESEEISALLREVDYEPAAEAPGAQATIVPNNQIAFGSGGQAQSTEQAPAEPAAPQPTAKELALAKAKADYEAAMAAATGGDEDEVGGSGGVAADGAGGATANTDVLGGAGSAQNSAASTPAPTGRKRRTKAEMEAARAASAQASGAQNGAGNVLEQATAGALVQSSSTVANNVIEPVAQQEQAAQPAATGAQPNVLDLLSKWASK